MTKPFHDVPMEIVGIMLMSFMIALGNAGGLSGAGTNIPIMLIFFDMTMHEAVPISGFVAVCSTIYRFLINFNQMHPNRPNRVCINYEVVEITMPGVFFGSFIGVLISQKISNEIKESVFALTVIWSIYTTAKKAIKMRKLEKEASLASQGVSKGPSSQMKETLLAQTGIQDMEEAEG
mmetsp:Transcript_13471/g.22919  ORF Transcript_13471/g.22919 Transcript_13471/m.22919 type:complete len:178 (+) Transcript_13471:310-843(+)